MLLFVFVVEVLKRVKKVHPVCMYLHQDFFGNPISRTLFMNQVFGV